MNSFEKHRHACKPQLHHLLLLTFTNTCTHMYTNTCNAPTHSKIHFTVIGIPYVFKGFYTGEQCACQIPNQLEFKLPAISDQLQEG